MSGILNGLADVLSQAMQLYMLAVFVAVVINLVGADPLNPIVKFFRRITEPLFQWIRRRLPFVVVGEFDLSPLIVWGVEIFLQRALVDNLRHLGQ